MTGYPSIAKIRSFVAVAEHGRFRTAAEALHLSQPALSAHIADLEAELGVSLISRTTRSIRLTDDGERFLSRARRILSEIESAVADMRDGAALRRGRAVVAAIPTLAYHVLPTVLAEFVARNPNIEVRIVEGNTARVQRAVESGEADFGLCPELRHGLDLDFSPVVRDEFVALVPADHPLSRRRRVGLADVARYPLIATDANTNMREQMVGALAESGIDARPVFEFSHHHTVAAMIAAGNGIAVMPSLVVASLRQPDLRAVRMKEPRIYRSLGFVYRPGERLSPAARALLSDIVTAWHGASGARAGNLGLGIGNTLTPAYEASPLLSRG